MNKSAQQFAIDWVRTYTTEWLDGLNETTREALRKALELFITTPGMTMGDLMKLLPFEGHRLRRIATTEITRAYAAGAQLAGGQLAREFPGVRVIKTWFTNRDSLVCPICAPLKNVSVLIMDNFIGGMGGEYPHPPSCEECRCWMSARTDITESVPLQGETESSWLD